GNGNVSLRSAIEEANAEGGVSTITFNVGGMGPPGGGSPTIWLTQRTQLEISCALTITGVAPLVIARETGPNVPAFGLFRIGANARVTMTDLELTNGLNIVAGGPGGAIDNAGTLTIGNLNIHDNKALLGGGICNEPDATLTMNYGTMTYNYAGDGGGIWNA